MSNPYEQRGRTRKAEALVRGLELLCTGMPANPGLGNTPFTGGFFDSDNPLHWNILAQFARCLSTEQWASLSVLCGVRPPSAKTRIEVHKGIARQEQSARERTSPDGATRGRRGLGAREHRD